MTYKHIPVMVDEVVDFLDCRPRKIYVDCTLGGSGHAAAILEKIMPDGVLIGIDQDKDAIENAERVLEPYQANVRLFHDNFINLPDILSRLKIAVVDGILLDLGVSLHHLESSGRGFSFRKDEPLDMRMNIGSDTTAEDIIHAASEEDLVKIFQEYGEERWARRIARSISKEREQRKIASSKQLAQIICDAIPRREAVRQRIHPATRVFMALRIAVNKELERLDSFLKRIADYMAPKGRLCVISFHSLEDRIVKHRLKELERGCTCPPDLPKCICNKKSSVRVLTPKVLRPAQEEIAVNPMARSARMRVAEKR
ncbi:MAG TPA: 16S rRNA (cytosine(1402)-N(4))-methyltransferase RsmH [Desulfobacterales bacterium]|nr:16S rRNA (cytosine(1402)-N(4))-methyltransferase RsmH [Desulfobacterales bacterium]